MPVRLFHVSDIHFGREDKAAVAWFESTVRAERPDAVVMTGDLTMRARSHEFAAACTWAERLGVPVTVEVGNHDLPYFNPWARLVSPYRRFRKLERAIERPLDLPGVLIVPLKTTARAQWRRNWSWGVVSRRSLAEALALIEAERGNRLALVACHHPLADPTGHTRPEANTVRGGEALAALASAGATAVLTGHVHDPFDVVHDAAGHPIRLIGAGTLSERVRTSAPSFNELIVEAGLLSVKPRQMMM